MKATAVQLFAGRTISVPRGQAEVWQQGVTQGELAGAIQNSEIAHRQLLVGGTPASQPPASLERDDG